MEKEYLDKSQEIFKQVIDNYHLKSAFVPTCDELLLSRCLDNHKKVNMQAYFFRRENRNIQVKYDESYLQIATLDNLQEIVEKTGDFLENHEEKIKNKELYILRVNNEFLGLGIISKNKIIPNLSSLGVYTVENYRRQGVGKSIIFNLANIVEREGREPIVGCWYNNKASKINTENCGFRSKTRLLHIEF